MRTKIFLTWLHPESKLGKVVFFNSVTARNYEVINNSLDPPFPPLTLQYAVEEFF